MKLKYLTICALFALLAITSACRKETWQKPYIEFANATYNEPINLDMNGGSFELSMFATRDWKIDSIPAWIGVSKESGTAMSEFEKITIAAPENPGNDRSAQLVFIAGPVKEYLNIAQKGPDGK